jgi:hypothetical protein
MFNREHNSFNLNLVDIVAAYQSEEGFGSFVQLHFGSDANTFAPVGTGTDDEFDVQEAFVQYAYGPFTAVGGKFVILAGAEVIESPANLNFSRSILFGYAEPFTHTGVRVQLKTIGGATFTVGVNNGWHVFRDSQSTVVDAAGNTIDAADDKTVELGASFTPFEPLSISTPAYIGDQPGLTKVGRRDLIDVVVSYTATDALSFVLSGDVAQQNDAIAAGTDATGTASPVTPIINSPISGARRYAASGSTTKTASHWCRAGMERDHRDLGLCAHRRGGNTRRGTPGLVRCR